MAVKVVMPRISQTMTEGTLLDWTVPGGAVVNKNDDIAEVEGEKITFEIKAPAAGVLRHLAEAGQTVKVSTIIGYITQPGEEMPSLADDNEQAETVSQPQSNGETIKASDTILASPSTRRLAKEGGVDLSKIKGSGKDGRITDQDVLDWIGQQKDLTPQVKVKKVIPLSGIRGVIAREMVSSLHTAAQLTAMVEMDATEMVEWYRNNKTVRDITYTDLFTKAVSLALEDHPIMNAHVVDEEIHCLEEINIGVAVALKDGLVVPVVQNANRLSLGEISQQVLQLAQKAGAGKLTPAEVSSGTFTITNMGMHGIDFGTPIIYQPQVAILAIGRIVEKPAIYQGAIVQRAMVCVSLTYDHRVTDGVPPAEFLQSLAALLRNPGSWIK